jgi:hypothetical protein
MQKYSTENADTYFDRAQWLRHQEFLDYVRREGRTLDATCVEKGGGGNFSSAREAYGEIIPVPRGEQWRITDKLRAAQKKGGAVQGSDDKKPYKRISPFEIPLDQLKTRHVYTK